MMQAPCDAWRYAEDFAELAKRVCLGALLCAVHVCNPRGRQKYVVASTLVQCCCVRHRYLLIQASVASDPLPIQIVCRLYVDSLYTTDNGDYGVEAGVVGALAKCAVMLLTI